jgi:hypothetical protein
MEVGPYAYYYVPVAASMALLAGGVYAEVQSTLRTWQRIALPLACRKRHAEAVLLTAG